MSLPAAPAHPRPLYALSVDGQDITARLAGRLVSLTLTDNRGFEADQLDIVLDDADGRLDLPPRGAEIRLAIGWAATGAEGGLVDKGSFTVDEVEHAGAPDTLTIRARSADLRAGLSTQMERSFHGKTVGDIVRTIADEVGLEPLISPRLEHQVMEHLDQTNESSANLLTRLATMFDAVATVKNGRLLFIDAGAAVSASGRPLPTTTITREAGDSHRFSIADRETYTHVRATYHDVDRAEKGEVIWGREEDDAERNRRPAPAPRAPDGSPPRYKDIAPVQKSRARAQRRAQREWQRLARSAQFRAHYDGVKVAYVDRVMNVSGEVTYGKADEEKAAKSAAAQARRDADKLAPQSLQVALEPGAGNIKTLRHVYANRTNAARAARAEWRRLQRGMASFTLTLARGRPELFPELPVIVSGFKPAIDNTDWLITRVTHNLAESGYTTTLELEIRATEIPG